MSFNVGPRTISATGGSIKRVGNYRIHTFPSELVTDGLVFNLDAGDPRSYPGSGTTWTDLSGYNQTGTLTNGPTYNNANGGSFAFSKAGLKYSESTASAFNITGANAKFTLEAWARNTTDGVYNTVLSIGTRYAQIGFHANATFMYGANGGGGNILIYPSGHTVGNWYHLVMTFEGLGDNIAKFYVNGSLLSSGNIGNNGNTTTTSIRIGAFATSGTEFLDGNVAVARVYNKALSAAEIAQNYDALKVRYTGYTNTFTPLCGGGSGKVEVLCVAGGGGGGSFNGGGGGAGGLLYNSAFTVNSNTGIGVTIGAGGIGDGRPGHNNNTTGGSGVVGTNGGNSVFSSLTAIGGGVGATYSARTSGVSGGSGGGSWGSLNFAGGTAGQGNAGGGGYPIGNNYTETAGGGGGAGGNGVNGGTSSNQPGAGGLGLLFNISGNAQFYAAGGAAGANRFGGSALGGSGIGGNGGTTSSLVGVAGVPNTGSGGGGAAYNGTPGSSADGGNGSNGIVIVRYPATDYNVELLIVGGGGGGGYCKLSDGGGGGGGAGGVIYYSSYPVSAGTKYSVTVGAGGNGSTVTDGSVNGANGQNSIFGTLVTIGGGGGGSTRNSSTLNVGGSGGGAGSDVGNDTGGFGTSGQGNNGGNNTTGNLGAGGGGGGAVGTSVTAGTDVPNGGIGLVYSITGTSTYYAGGGGGGKFAGGSGNAGTGGLGGGGNGGKGAAGSNGTANTGGGGGGGGMTGGVSGFAGGNGGSGIIIIAYQGPQRGLGGTVNTTSRPGYTLHTFTTTGTDFFIP
jgi:hypothetical protein